jgi:hypothetical protein
MTRFALLLTALALLAPATPAFAATVRVKNCTKENVKIGAFNRNDKVKWVRSDWGRSKRVHPSEVRGLKCATKKCQVAILVLEDVNWVIDVGGQAENVKREKTYVLGTERGKVKIISTDGHLQLHSGHDCPKS